MVRGGFWVLHVLGNDLQETVHNGVYRNIEGQTAFEADEGPTD